MFIQAVYPSEVRREVMQCCCLQVGTLQYLAPEVLQKQPAGYASDVYAWAVTVNEVATGAFPFSDCTKDNPQAHTILDFGYGRCAHALPVYVTSKDMPAFAQRRVYSLTFVSCCMPGCNALMPPEFGTCHASIPDCK